METKSKKTLEVKMISHPMGRIGRRLAESNLTPVSLTGVVVPWSRIFKDGQSSDFKLACPSGLEYSIVADSEWREVMSWYCGEEVKVIGLLNAFNMTIIPQKVFPKGPTGDRDNVIDLATWKGREFVKRMAKNVSELVLIPAALCAVMI